MTQTLRKVKTGSLSLEAEPPQLWRPSYLVWLSPLDDPEEYPWPYQVVAIELVSSSDALAGLDPDGSNPGHALFVTHCLKCHAINGIGGTYGPELNSPCSVTEYWNPRLLSRFIANARQYSSWNQDAQFRFAAGEKTSRQSSSIFSSWPATRSLAPCVHKRSGHRSVTKSLQPLPWILRDAQVWPSAQIARQRRLCRRFL